MVSAHKALIGKRVYRGVSHSPNKGPVSGKGKTGYIRREVRKKSRARGAQLSLKKRLKKGAI